MRRLLILCALLFLAPALSATAQAGPGPAQAFAWKTFEACLAVSGGKALDLAAAEAGYRLERETWIALAGDREFHLSVAPIPGAPTYRSCNVGVLGPLSDHDGFVQRIADWATAQGFEARPPRTTPGGGALRQFSERGAGGRIVVITYFAPGNPDQQTRTVFFFAWKPQ